MTFCNCDNCKQARIHKGKSIRKRASILINDDLIVDLESDTATSMAMYDKDMGKVKYLLQTHIHTDHYDAGLLCSRIPYYADKNCIKIMSDRVNDFEKADLVSEEGSDKLNVHSNEIKAGEVVSFGNYKVKAIKTTHDIKHGSLLYVISSNNKNLFYATDTPSLTDEALEQLKDIKLDVVIMDHAFGNTDYYFSHLNEKLFIKQIEKLEEINCIDNNTLIFGTHISHDGNGYHEMIEKKAKSNSYHIAYDGMELDI